MSDNCTNTWTATGDIECKPNIVDSGLDRSRYTVTQAHSSDSGSRDRCPPGVAFEKAFPRVAVAPFPQTQATSSAATADGKIL